MSGLSARTYSCSGEGVRFLAGGSLTAGAGILVVVVLGKYFWMPFFLGAWRRSSSECTEDSSEDSSDDMVAALLWEEGAVYLGRVWWWKRDEVKSSGARLGINLGSASAATLNRLSTLGP